MYEWGNTREGWEGGDGVVWSDFRRVRLMVVRVIWRVTRLTCCRVYVKSGTECVGIKVEKLWTIDMTKLLDGYVKGCARMHFY